MTHSDLPPHFYSDLVGDALDDYARNQLADTSEGLKETLRLWREMYEAVGTESGHHSKWLEWWSATVHYSAASAANFGVLMSALGAPRRPAAGDGRRPSHQLRIPGATNPRCVALRRLGASDPEHGAQLQPKELPPSLVTIRQRPDQQGTELWTFTVDLSNHPERGTYFMQISPTGGLSDPSQLIERHVYLDPNP